MLYPASQLNANTDVRAFAEKMDVSVNHLVWLARHASEQYQQFDTPKRSGGTRLIYNPSSVLRQAQAFILASILEPVSPSDFAMAYRKGRSISDALRPHIACLTLVRIDLADHYGHIKAGDVFHTFRSINVLPSLADVLTDLCVLYHAGGIRSLPQGGICSPALSNLYMRSFDKDLASLASQWCLVYTRYADDLLLSSKRTLGKACLKRLEAQVSDIAARYGQEVNERKTREMVGAARKSALGLTVGDKVSMFRQARHNFRSMCYRIDNARVGYGTDDMVLAEMKKARGIYGYMCSVDPEHAAMFAERFGWLNDRS